MVVINLGCWLWLIVFSGNTMVQDGRYSYKYDPATRVFEQWVELQCHVAALRLAAGAAHARLERPAAGPTDLRTVL